MLVIELTRYRGDGELYDQMFFREDEWNRACSDIKFATRLDKCSADIIFSDPDLCYPYTHYNKSALEVHE